MAWALVEPNGFGEFFPYGDQVGWDEQIKRHFNEEMSAEQRAVFNNWDVNFRERVSRKFTQDLGPLEPHEFPSEFRLAETRKSIGSIILLPNRLLAVDATLKKIIEGLEAGVHQFWPMKISMPKGGEYPVAYFGMIIRRFIDSFVPDQSTGYLAHEGADTYRANSPLKKDYGGLTVSRRVIAGAHLWRERRLLTPNVCLSNELQAELARKGLRIFKHHQLREI